MTIKNLTPAALSEMSFDEADEALYPRPEQSGFQAVLERALDRRSILRGGIGLGLSALALGTTSLSPIAAKAATSGGFEPLPTNTLDTVTVPKGYSWQILAKWGEPMWSSAPAFDHSTGGTAESQERSFGDNNDGMAVFERDGRVVLAVNNEYTNKRILWRDLPDHLPQTADEINKGKAAHGVSVVELARTGGRWAIVKDSPLNRRITPDTLMEITGPARGHALLQTSADPTGIVSLGTWNNCGNGRTPWGTYLTCEENFNGYFSAEDPDHTVSPELARYGVSGKDWGYRWAKVDSRFDVSKEPNEPNRAGYVVEIDPMDPVARPKKRTALGRFKHENCEVVIAESGHVVAYMGDDERGEFLYRFVSAGRYQDGGDNADLLDEGILYVAQFDDTQTGRWLALTPETTGMTAAEICIHTRLAASKVGATTMDRPEWVAAHPSKAEIYCALTNNKNRGLKPNAGGDPTPVGGPNPREANLYGQIVRWWPKDGDHTVPEFDWDLFVMAGNPVIHDDLNAGSENLSPDNMFNSPDGLAFDTQGRLWIQTDGNYSNEGGFAGHGNNQMLVGDPETGEIKRFLVGPNECEITGITWSPDKRTLFVGIQHPGERGNSQFPEGAGTLPRSAVIAITRDDGAAIG